MRTALFLTVLMSIALPGAHSAHANDLCKPVKGGFFSVPPDECASPVGICSIGLLTGDFPAIYKFTADTIYPSGDPTAPNKFIYTGTSVITTLSTSPSQIHARDKGYMLILENGTASFSTRVTFVEGTNRFHGGSGELLATGIMSLSTWRSRGTYAGTVCEGRR